MCKARDVEYSPILYMATALSFAHCHASTGWLMMVHVISKMRTKRCTLRTHTQHMLASCIDTVQCLLHPEMYLGVKCCNLYILLMY